MRRLAFIALLSFSVTWSPVLKAQSVVTLVSPTSGTRFQKAVSMELNIQLRATVTPFVQNERVYFYANGQVIGSAHSSEAFTTMWSNVNFGTYDLLVGTGPGPAPGQPVTIHVESNGVALVNERAPWRYLDGGADPGPDWMHAAFDTSLWLTGVPQFGFGDDDEQTVVNWYNPADGLVFPTYYFKHFFLVTNSSSYSNAVVRLLRDDGAIVYLNGVEIIRDNMPAGAVSKDTYAVAPAAFENEFTDWHINPGRLVEGTNHIAVEIHNQGPVSHDIGFDLRLLANIRVLPPALVIERQGTNVILSWPRSYLGYALEVSDSLTTPDWRRNTNLFTTSTEFRSTNAATSASGFYRLRIE